MITIHRRSLFGSSSSGSRSWRTCSPGVSNTAGNATESLFFRIEPDRFSPDPTPIQVEFHRGLTLRRTPLRGTGKGANGPKNGDLASDKRDSRTESKSNPPAVLDPLCSEAAVVDSGGVLGSPGRSGRFGRFGRHGGGKDDQKNRQDAEEQYSAVGEPYPAAPGMDGGGDPGEVRPIGPAGATTAP